MAYTAGDITALKEAIGSGALRVRYADGREVLYRSLAEMRQILNMMEGEVNGRNAQRTSVAGF